MGTGVNSTTIPTQFTSNRQSQQIIDGGKLLSFSKSQEQILPDNSPTISNNNNNPNNQSSSNNTINFNLSPRQLDQISSPYNVIPPTNNNNNNNNKNKQDFIKTKTSMQQLMKPFDTSKVLSNSSRNRRLLPELESSDIEDSAMNFRDSSGMLTGKVSKATAKMHPSFHVSSNRINAALTHAADFEYLDEFVKQTGGKKQEKQHSLGQLQGSMSTTHRGRDYFTSAQFTLLKREPQIHSHVSTGERWLSPAMRNLLAGDRNLDDPGVESLMKLLHVNMVRMYERGDKEKRRAMRMILTPNKLKDLETSEEWLQVPPSYEEIKEYFTQFVAMHRRCGPDCSHLKRFQRNFGMQRHYNHKQVLILGKPLVYHLPKINRARTIVKTVYGDAMQQ